MPHPVHWQAATNTPAGKNQPAHQELDEGFHLGTTQFAFEH
jgi:hypothetical protein